MDADIKVTKKKSLKITDTAAILNREKRLTELWLILLNLLHLGIVTESRFYELLGNLLSGALKDIQSLIDYQAKHEGLPVSSLDDAAAVLTLIMDDAHKQIQGLDAGADAEEIKTRVRQSAIRTIWDGFNRLVRGVAQRAGLKVVWRTMQDERVCPVCGELDGKAFTPDEAPSYPHAGCRCWLEWILR